MHAWPTFMTFLNISFVKVSKRFFYYFVLYRIQSNIESERKIKTNERVWREILPKIQLHRQTILKSGLYNTTELLDDNYTAYFISPLLGSYNISSWLRRTHLATFLLNSGKFSRHSLAASTLAGLWSFGSASIEMTEIMIVSTVWMGNHRSQAFS